MRRLMIAVAGLAWLAGCAEQAPPPAEASIPPGPLPGETFADPEDPDVEACLATVSRNTGSPDVTATGMFEGIESTVISIDADGAPWRCTVDDRGRVTAIVPVSGR